MTILQIEKFTAAVPFNYAEIQQLHDSLPVYLQDIDFLRMVTDYARATAIDLKAAKIKLTDGKFWVRVPGTEYRVSYNN